MTKNNFTGDESGHDLVYLDCRELNTFKQITREQLLSEVNSGRVSFSTKAISLYLRNGFFPPPYTPYYKIYSLTSGDRLSLGSDGFHIYKQEFPYMETNSSGQSDPDKFDDVFVNLVSGDLPRETPLSLLLSGGKDSTAILLALKEKGFDNVECYTYQTGFRLDETPYAQRLANYLGYKHHIVSENPVDELRGLNLAADSGQPFVADLALPAYCAILGAIKNSESIVIDGMGNDIYCGHLPPKRESLLRRLSLPRLGAPSLWACAPLLNLDERVDYVLQSVFMYPVERFFSGSRLEVREVSCGDHVNFVREYVQALSRQVNGMDEMSARAFIRGRLFDCCAGMEKARIAASSRSFKVKFPFAHKGLADYWFDLPSEKKYDFKNRVNKRILRDFIRKRTGGLEMLNEKGSFRFNINRFLLQADSVFQKSIRDSQSKLPFSELSELFCSLRKHPNNYVASCRAFLIGVLGLWVQRSGIDITVDIDEKDPFVIDTK